MAEGLADFLKTVGPEFDGKAQLVLDATGAKDLEELVDLTDCREDLRDLDKEGVDMKALHVKKLFKAIMQLKERGPQGPAPPPPSPAEMAEAEPARPPPRVFPKLEKAMTAVPEDQVKEPSCYVACSDASRHEDIPLPAPQEASGGYPAAASSRPKTKVAMPDPMGRGPILFNKPGPGGRGAAAAAGQAQFEEFQAGAQDFPGLGPAGRMPAVTRSALDSGSGVAAAQRAAQAAELARLAALQAEQAALDAAGGGAAVANAALAQRMLRDRRGACQLRREAYDRVLEFFWDAHTYMFEGGRVKHGVPSPISELSEEAFPEAFREGLKAFCEANQPEGGAWATPEIEDFLMYQPSPTKSKKGKEIRPHVLVMFKSLEDVQYLEHIYVLRAQSDSPQTIPVMKVKNQALSVQRPNPDYVQKVESSKGSETASQAASAAGSVNSHSSVSRKEQRNLTLLFLNVPEALYASLSQRPAAKSAIEAYVAKILQGSPALPIARDSVKFSASFSDPKKAPYCGCWLTFRYTDESKRINPGDGKAYSFEALKAQYKGKKDDLAVLKLWERSVDAAYELEKALAGGAGKKPVSIARWVLDRIQEKKVPPPHGFERESHTWTECELGGSKLSVQFKRPGS